MSGVFMSYSAWYLVPEKGYEYGSIKRYIRKDGKTSWQRFPKASYKGLDPQEIEALLRRLNATHEIKKQAAINRYDFHHAYVNQKSLAKFEDYLASQADDREHIHNTMTILKIHVLDFFIVKANLPDPKEWYRQETEWGKWLLAKNLSTSSLKRSISTANRFTKFLSSKVYPEMGVAHVLEPIGKNKFKTLSPKKSDAAGFVSPSLFAEILSHLERGDSAILPNVILCYKLGLRIGETQGLTREKFFKTHVLVDEQGDRFVNGIVLRRPVKTKDERKVPYWYISGKEAWELVKALKPMSPFTVIDRVNAGLRPFAITSHDFRRTFITNALRGHHWKDVQKAVGHKDVRTTMGYNRDDRGLDDERLDLD